MALSREHLLAVAGWLSAAVALLHVVIIFLGAPAYRYFGAGEDMARQAEAGSFLPAGVTLAVTVVFVAFALYAFAGAGQLRRPPLLRTGLITIAAIYLLRGLGLFPELAQYARDSSLVMPRQLAFSLVSLIIGLLYLMGTVLLWPRLRPVRHRARTLLSILLLCLLASGAAAQQAAPAADGTLVEQTPCPPDTTTHEQYVEMNKGFYAREVEAAAREGIRIEMPADPTQGLLSKADFERQRAYEGFECRRIKYLSDNLKVVGFLWKPKDTEGKKLPLVIFNRGGNREFGKLTPWAQRGFYSYVSNGFVVLGSQYRGNDGGEGSDEFGGADVRTC